MGRKIIQLLLIITLLGILGFGCKSLSVEQQQAIKPVVLNYWTVFNNVGLLNQFAAEYKKIRPYVTVKIRQVREDEFADLFIKALADDVPPDIVSIQARDVGEYSRWLSPMPVKISLAEVYVKGQYFKETVVNKVERKLPTLNELKSAYISTVYEDIARNEQVFGLPLAVDTLALYYNKELLDQAGVPEPPKTWEEFMAMVKATTRFDGQGNILQSGAALGTGNNISRAADILTLFMLQSGAPVAQGNQINFANGLEKAPESHPTFSALRFYTDFAQPTKEVYTWNESKGDAWEAFARGQVVFYFGFAYDYPRLLSRSPQMRFAVALLPQLNPDKPSNVANYWLESVVGKSKNKDEAWEFISYITGPAQVKKYIQTTKQPTPYRAQIEEQKQDPAAAPFVETVLQAENWYRGRDKKTAEKALTDLIHDYLQPFAGADKDKLKRDAQLIIQAAQTMKQTM